MIFNLFLPDEVCKEMVPDENILKSNKDGLENILHLLFITKLLQEYPEVKSLKQFAQENMSEITEKAVEGAFNMVIDSIVGSGRTDERQDT
jgi:hypothetical protein